jgi:hypothetical protein
MSGGGLRGWVAGPPPMVPAGTVVMSAGAQALALEQGILGPSSPIPTQCLLLKNMFDPKECALALPAGSCRRSATPSACASVSDNLHGAGRPSPTGTRTSPQM